jgi:hypothetical protein
MKTYEALADEVPHVLDLSTEDGGAGWNAFTLKGQCHSPRYKYVVSFIPLPLYPYGESPWHPLYRIVGRQQELVWKLRSERRIFTQSGYILLLIWMQ